MLEFVNHDEYVKLTGKSIPADFTMLVREASNYINYKTSGRIDINNIPEVVKYTTCLIINEIQEEKEKLKKVSNLKSQNIEGWSETYSTPEEIKKEYADRKYQILKQNFWNVIGKDGNLLLYCGVC